MLNMRGGLLFLLSLLVLPSTVFAQGTVPVFEHAVGQGTYTFAGGDPAQGRVTTVPTVLVPVTLSFEAKKVAGKPFAMSADADVARVLRSPVFAKASFGAGEKTQYIDAMMRATFPAKKGWRTLLGRPQVKPVKVTIPAGYGYVLTSKKSGGAIAVVDSEYLQKELFKQVPRQEGKLVIVLTHNTTFYALQDATVCCSWGTHGVDSATGNSFVLGSYLHGAPAIIQDRDVQPLTEQLAEFFYDPLRNPMAEDPALPEERGKGRRNVVPRWSRPMSLGFSDEGSCGGSGIGSTYFLLQPTDLNHKNDFPASKPFVARVKGETYHVQNVALLGWYLGKSEGLSEALSFPDRKALEAAATPCPERFTLRSNTPLKLAIKAVPRGEAANGHQLIGYWTGPGLALPLRDVSPQWDVVIVAFATPDKSSAGTLHFRLPRGDAPEEFKADVAYLKSKGKKVMISLGGGGQFFTMPDAASTQRFLDSVTSIVSEYGFDGIDLDFESPSLAIDPGDTDFRHPKTPSIVNMIGALRKLHEHFGPGFMISLVPEGTQIPAGYPSYGGQFGSYLPIAYATSDILSFVDVQDYNTPPLQGLDGEIYQIGTADYDAAMTELLLRGFNVGGDPAHFFPGLPASKVAVGFLTGYSTPKAVSEAMDFIITGKAPAGTTYQLRRPGGYPEMIGAMFWTIDADKWGDYKYSNLIGPQLHGYPAAK